MEFKKIGQKVIDDICKTSSDIGEKSVKAIRETSSYISKTASSFTKTTQSVSSNIYDGICKTKNNISEKTTEMYSKLTEVVCISDELLERKVSNKLVIFSLLVFLWILFHAFYSFK